MVGSDCLMGLESAKGLTFVKLVGSMGARLCWVEEVEQEKTVM